MEDEELIKMYNFTLKMSKTILFFLTVVINELTCIDLEFRLDTRGRKR